jgi:hemerythrin superfamily protein
MQSDIGLPARGHDAVEILINDHQIVKALLEQLSNARDTTQRTGVLEQLKAALTVHNATEENLVYPALAQVAGRKSEAQHLYHETAAADLLIFELDTMLKEGDESDFESKASTLREAILEHIDDEEEKAFPHLRDNAEPQQAQMLTESVREFRSALRFVPSERGVTERGTIQTETPRSRL